MVHPILYFKYEPATVPCHRYHPCVCVHCVNICFVNSVHVDVNVCPFFPYNICFLKTYINKEQTRFNLIFFIILYNFLWLRWIKMKFNNCLLSTLHFKGNLDRYVLVFVTLLPTGICRCASVQYFPIFLKR